MGTRVSEILRRLRLTDRCREDPDSDPTLLNKYIADGNEDAFHSLVRRHGPMVLGVCRRILGDPHTAEDAFQATFLALARHASGIRRPGAVAAWLHGVARRAALRLHSASVRCGADQLASDPPATAQLDPLTRVSARELLTALDEELQRLPERYRLAIVHCHLEGGTVDEAASRLATTPGAVRGWLARGRDRLAERLAARGFSLPSALLAVAAETVTELPAVAASGASAPPAITAAADAAVNSGSGYRLAWAAIATAGITAGIATAGLVLTHWEQQVVAPIAAGPKPKNSSQNEFPESLPPGALARLGTVRFKLASFPLSVQYSPDGKRLVLGDASGDVIVFDAGTGRIVRQFRSFDERNEAVPLYSPGGEHLAVVTRGGRVGIWHADKGDAPLWTLPSDDTSVRRLAFSHDGKLLIGAEEGSESRVRLWDATNGHEQRSLPVHPKSVTGVAVSPDGKSLATSCEDGSVRLFDPKSAKQVRRFDHPNRRATAVAWSPDGKTLAWALTGSQGDKPVAEVILWRVVDDKEVARAESPGEAIRELVFTPDSQKVLGSDPDGTHVWDPRIGKEIRFLRNVGIGTYPTLAVSPDSKTLATPGRKEIAFNDLGTGKRSEPLPGPQQQVSALAYAPNGKTVAVGSGDGRVYLYDPATGELRRELNGDSNGVTGVAFAPDGKMLAVTAGHSKFVHLWDAASGELVRTLTHPDKDGGFATAVSYSPDGKLLAVTSYGIIRLYDPTTGEQVRRFVKKESGKVNAVTFSPDGKLLAAVGDDRSINLWDTATGKEVAAWHLPHTTFIKSVAFSPDGKRLVWGAHGGWCQVWEVTSGRTLARIRGHEYGVESVAFTPDGKRVVTTGTFDTGPRVWEAETGKELLGFRGHLDNPGAVAVAPDGKSAASAGNDGQVLIWDIDTPPAGIKPIGPPRVSSEVARIPKDVVRLGVAGSSGDHIAFSADGKRLAATVLIPGSEAGLVMWDMATRKPVWQIENDRERVFSLSWSAEGTAVVTVGDFDGGVSLALWDAETGKELTRVRGLPSICDYALSPDSKTVAARHHSISTAMGERFGGEIDLFDVATGKRLRRLEGHDGDSVAWSPDGKLLVSGSSRSSSIHTIRVWDPATGKVVREWDSGQGAATTLLFLPDGMLASGPGDSGNFRVWDVRTGKLLRETKGGGGAVQVALSADGKRAAWHGFSSPVVVQNAETGRRLGTYQAGPRWYGFALSPDGKTLATTGNGNLFLWPVPFRGGDD